MYVTMLLAYLLKTKGGLCFILRFRYRCSLDRW